MVLSKTASQSRKTRLRPRKLQVHNTPPQRLPLGYGDDIEAAANTFCVRSLIIQLCVEPEEPADAKAIGGQTDGAPEAFGGSSLQEPEYTVDVKLSDLQADPNNPLYSVKSFEELGL